MAPSLVFQITSELASFCFRPYTTPVNWKKPDAASVVKPVQPAPAQGQKKLDLNAVGVVNGQSIYEYDVDASDEKPWRKPGMYDHDSK